jgi:cytochrome c-type biogenesis protein CcmH
VLLFAVFAGLTAAVLFLLVRPLLGEGESGAARASFDSAVYRDQLNEIESDRARGLIAEKDAEAARTEIARRLLAADAEVQAGERGASTVPMRALAAGLAVVLPLFAISLYLQYGSPRLPDQPLIARLSAPGADKNLEALVARVEARLREHPEEGAGWDAIAPVYMSWGRFADAADAYEQAIRLLGESPKRLAGQGRALVFEQGGVVNEDARKALERALVLDSTLMDARVLLILAKEQDGKLAEAAAEWRALLEKSPADAPWRAVAEKRLADLEAKLSGKPVATEAPRAQATDDGAPSAAEVAAAERMGPAERKAMIERMVDGLANRLAEKGDDLPGWLKLVRAYAVLERKEDALKALERARTQFSGNAPALRELDNLAADLGLKS